MKNFNLFLVCVLGFILSYTSQAQTVENVVLEFNGERISVTYDLNFSASDQKFRVSLYSSYDNYQNPISLVSGEIGSDVVPGRQKKIIWDVRNELPADFESDLSIKVKATAIIANYKFNPLAKNTFKKGKNLSVQWEGGRSSDQLKIDLLKNNIFQQTIAQTPNTKGHTWAIPKEFDKGSGYSLRLSNTVNASQKTTSTAFNIKSTTPLYLKLGIPLIIGVVVAVLVGGGRGGETPDPGLSELPGPITPDGG